MGNRSTNESQNAGQPDATQHTAPSAVDKKTLMTPQLIMVMAGEISVGVTSLLIRWWARGVWDFTKQASDDWLTVMSCRPRLCRVLVDRKLLSEEAVAAFQQANPGCEIDLNVVAQ